MPIREGLHHIVGWDGTMFNRMPLDERPAFHREVDGSVGGLGRSLEREPDLVLIRWHLGTRQPEAFWRVRQVQANLISEPVPAKRIHGHGDRSAAANAQAGRDNP